MKWMNLTDLEHSHHFFEAFEHAAASIAPKTPSLRKWRSHVSVIDFVLELSKFCFIVEQYAVRSKVGEDVVDESVYSVKFEKIS